MVLFLDLRIHGPDIKTNPTKYEIFSLRKEERARRQAEIRRNQKVRFVNGDFREGRKQYQTRKLFADTKKSSNEELEIRSLNAKKSASCNNSKSFI